MAKIIAEYVWIDAFKQLRSKAQVLENIYITSYPFYPNNNELPVWNFDGSSTGQAETDDSEIVIKPRIVFKDPFRLYGILVLCDCYDGKNQPIESNKRYYADEIFQKVKEHKPWYGLEQEYVIFDMNTKRPLGWPAVGYPEKQGKYYCGIGPDRAFGRRIANEHFEACLNAGIKICGINGEVLPGQWEFQIGPCEGIDAGDHLWMARYILGRICEHHNAYISYHPKPEKGDWNGSGCHTNFSSLAMRQENGLEKIYDAIDKLEKCHEEHIKVYGDNSERLSGKHETSDIHTFTYGISDRSASIRIPLLVSKQEKGYFEDRRPASDCDPYEVTSILAKTCLI